MFKEWRISTSLALLSILLVFTVAFYSPGDYQGGDTYLHYLIARYAPIHPELYLDHWGKPIYTLIYSLPAQVSYEFTRLFTVCLAGLTAIQVQRWSKELGLSSQNYSAVILLLSPIYIWMSISAMTEILFGLWMVIGFRGLTRERWIISSLWLSFLPFVRTEGFVLLPFVALWLLQKGKWRIIPLFGTGTIVYSIIGGFYFHDFLWLINKNPYPTEVAFYGSGKWLHFLESLKLTWGISFFSLMVIGIFFLLKKGRSHFQNGWFLVTIPALVYLLFHTIAWATGTMASIGEIRVLAAIMPLCAVIASIPISELSERFKGKLDTAIGIVAFLVLATNAYLIIRPPILQKKEVEVMARTADYIEKNYSDKKVWCTDIQIAKELNKDVWNKSEYEMYLVDTASFSSVMNKGDLIVWDAHYSPNEGRTPLNNLLNYKGLEEIKRFYPEKSFTVLGGLQYEVVLFVVK